MQLMSPSQALKRAFVGADAFDDIADKISAKNSRSDAYHAFRIGDIGLLIPQDIISEVADQLAYCQLPNTQTILFGMANLRGNIIPLFNLHDLFGFSTPSKTASRILIIGRGDDAVAVLISELPQRITFTVDHRLKHLPPMPEALQPYLKNHYQKDGVWLEIDYHGFFEFIGGLL